MHFIQQPKVYRLLLARTFDSFSSGMFMMALPWMMLKMGNNGAFVALVAVACTLTSFLLTPFFSTLIDRYSRKAIMVNIQLLQVITPLILIFTLQLEHLALWLMAGAQIIYWISTDIGWSTNNALTQENFEKSQYPKISSYQEVIMQSVSLGAGGLGVILLEHWDMTLFSWFAAIASFLGMLSYLSLPYDRKLKITHHTSFAGQLLDTRNIVSAKPELMIFLLLSCISYPIMMYLYKLVPVYLAEYNHPGYWFALWKTACGLGAVICGVMVVRLLCKFTVESLITHSLVIMAGLMFVMGIFLSPLIIITVTLVLGFFSALIRIARFNKMNHEISVDERGRIDGALVLFSTLMQTVFYILIAVLAHYQLTQFGFLIGAVLVLVASMWSLIYRARHQDKINITEHICPT